jgi:hypothetical protein
MLVLQALVLQGLTVNSDIRRLIQNALFHHRKRVRETGRRQAVTHRCATASISTSIDKESNMASNQKSGGNKQGSSQSGSGSKQSGNKGSASGGTQGGTPEQHAEAGRQSHKNDGKKSSSRGK